VIAGNEYNSSATLGMTQYSTYYIGVALLPAPFVLLYLPGINDITHKIQCVTGVVLKKVIETIRLTIFGTKMNITDKD
jgi:TRAP-type mannitol/chloroaromatic compound transport system permease small subunit